MKMNKNNDFIDKVYVSVSYIGYIPELKVVGPFKSFISIDQLKMLIDNDYDVVLVNPNACPEFAKQYEEFKVQKVQEDAKKAEIKIKSILDENPNSMINKILNTVENQQPSKEVNTDYINDIISNTNNTVDRIINKIENKQTNNTQDSVNLYDNQINLINSFESNV